MGIVERRRAGIFVQEGDAVEREVPGVTVGG